MKIESELIELDFNKLGGLVPVVIQDAEDSAVLMVGFMNQQAFEATLNRNRVVFWSRTKNRLWEKGEESGNVLDVVSIDCDCDKDSLLIRVRPAGPTCHTGATSCFN